MSAITELDFHRVYIDQLVVKSINAKLSQEFFLFFRKRVVNIVFLSLDHSHTKGMVILHVIGVFTNFQIPIL